MMILFFRLFQTDATKRKLLPKVSAMFCDFNLQYLFQKKKSLILSMLLGACGRLVKVIVLA